MDRLFEFSSSIPYFQPPLKNTQLTKAVRVCIGFGSFPQQLRDESARFLRNELIDFLASIELIWKVTLTPNDLLRTKFRAGRSVPLKSIAPASASEISLKILGEEKTDSHRGDLPGLLIHFAKHCHEEQDAGRVS